VDWKASFSLYYNELKDWFTEEVSVEMTELRARLLKLLQREAELKEVVQIIGVEALQESDRLTLEVAMVTRDVFLKQSVFSEHDAFNTYEKQYWMLKVLFEFLDSATDALNRGVFIDLILETPLKARVLSMKDEPNEGFEDTARGLIQGIEIEFGKAGE
jgi:V/A-type H+-transporting ATPase subunit A